MGESETRNIAAIALNCRSSITKLLAATTGEGYCVKDLLNTRDVQQMRDRFNQWAGNLGALHPFQSPLSIEHRLRDAPLVKESVLRTLSDLYSSIEAATDIAIGKRPNRVTKHLIVASDVDLLEYDLYPSESDSSSVSSSSSVVAPDDTSEMQELISAIRISIDNLFKSSIFIRNSASRQRRLRAERRDTFVNCADIVHVKDRYHLLKDDSALVLRLGEANARRRQYFKYVYDHNEYLAAEPMKDELDNVKAQDQPGVVRSETALTILTGETKTRLVAETAATTFVANEITQARTLGMPVAQEANSVTSFATSIAETLDEDLPFPPVPAEAENGSSFFCPYCCIYQEFKHGGVETKWRKHVLNDLEPYICTFSSCSLDTFQSQRAWFEHELMAHRSQWICPECSTSFRSSDGLKAHVSQNHSDMFSKQQLPAFIEQSKRPVDSIQPSECPFCDDPWAQADASVASDEEVLVVTPDQFRQHLGKHLQQVALFSLPRLSIEDQDQNQSLGPMNKGEVLDQDAISEGWYSRGNGWSIASRKSRGHGWSIVSRKWATFVALSYFLSHSRAAAKEEASFTLHKAAQKGKYEMVKLLLDQGADINSWDEDGRTPLQRASIVPDEKVIQLLLDRGASMGVELMDASHMGWMKTVQILLKLGWDVNLRVQGRYYNTALQAAVSGGNVEAMQILLEHGAEIATEDDEWKEVLQMASYKGHEKVFQFLLNRNVAVDCDMDRESFPNTLHAAARGGYEKLVELLLDHGANINSGNKYWDSALHGAAFRGHEKVVQLLLDRGANVDGTLTKAVNSGKEEVVQLILNTGVDIGAQEKYPGYAMWTAARDGHEKIVVLLLKNGASVDAQGNHENALSAAAAGGHYQIVKLLLSHGANVNDQGGTYGNALQAGAYGGYEQIVELLLKHGADVHAQGGDYGNAFQAASSRGHEKIKQRLLDLGVDEKAKGRGHAFITVTVLGVDHKLLIELVDSVRRLKKRLIRDIPSILETLKDEDPNLVRLVLDDKTLENPYQVCSKAGLKDGSHVFCHLEKHSSTDMEAQTQAVSAVPARGPSPTTVFE